MNTATNSVDVTLQFTPNPDTLKYETNITLVASGALNFPSRASAKDRSGLAEALFAENDIAAVMLGKTFVTISLAKQDRLMEINDWCIQIIRDYLESGKPVAIHSTPAPLKPLSEIEQKIVEILDRDIRPAVAMDGGDISFEKYEDGFVYLRMQGACSGCPSSMMTLKMGVETRLKDAIPEIKEIIPV
jgi:Fe-S cluster biogenesis protein NfuA